MTIIPAIDIIDGYCVRLTHGNYLQKKIYNTNPIEVAKQFEAAGIERLHLVDLDGAKAGKIVNFSVLENIAAHTKLKVDFGGGVTSKEDVKAILHAGAAFVTIGSLAVKNKNLFCELITEFGANKFFVGADVLNEKIKINGWLNDAGIGLFDFLDDLIMNNVTNIFCTDISKDGALKGPSIELYSKIIATYANINLVASGGVSNLHDVEQLKQIGCSGAIIGKALYEGLIEIKDLLKN
jgi:phosphoribosylformimino-5-aminoimidazole carboxamide ribotide isomerase